VRIILSIKCIENKLAQGTTGARKVVTTGTSRRKDKPETAGRGRNQGSRCRYDAVPCRGPGYIFGTHKQRFVAVPLADRPIPSGIFDHVDLHRNLLKLAERAIIGNSQIKVES
jgi:hypothetical protein